jgi:Ca-activated chloride channel family protein
MERMRKSAQEKDSPAAENEMLADRAMPVEENKKAKMEAAPAFAGAVASMPAPVSPIVSMDYAAPQQQEMGRDKFKDFEQNEIKSVAQEPLSTFSIDVDTASYAFVRSNLDNGTLPQVDSVRVEELINYFDYAYPAPAAKAEPFKTSLIVKPSPWNKDRKLVTVGIKGYDLEKTATPDSNLVFLLDVSGSMEEPNKLPLLKQSLSMLLETLKPTDKISIVVYAGAAGTVLPPTPVSDKNTILMALQNLQAGGSTAGAEGIRQAYQLAETNFNKDAVNRVILATDGDFNVGITSPDELQDFVERKREKGIFLSVLGFGRGNYNDDMMQRLAQNGNGVAAYIDTLNEARKVLVQEAGSTLFTIAKDVKIQVEFNPKTVSEYRLVGYETRALKTEDFNNDKVDAGDIGAGAEVTAIYEITPAGAAPAVDPSRYASSPAASSTPAVGGELAFVKVRYKLPDENTSKLITTPVLPDMNSGITAEAQLLQKETDWAVAVASFAQLLKGGKYTGSMTYDDILKLAEASKGSDPFGYRAEFITLIHKAKTAAAMQTQPTNQPGFVSPLQAR